jgi:hypothetical protein
MKLLLIILIFAAITHTVGNNFSSRPYWSQPTMPPLQTTTRVAVTTKSWIEVAMIAMRKKSADRIWGPKITPDHGPHVTGDPIFDDGEKSAIDMRIKFEV